MDEQRQAEVEEFAKKLEQHVDEVAGCLAVLLQAFGTQKAASVMQITKELFARKLPHLKLVSEWPRPYKINGRYAVLPFGFQREIGLLSGALTRDTALAVLDQVSDDGMRVQ